MSSTEINDTLYELCGLFQTDPKTFELKSRQLIDALIDDFPEDMKQRAKGWQFRLDKELEHYTDPISRMNAMVELFWKGFFDFQQVVADPGPIIAERKASRTVVIPLHKGDIDAAGPFCPIH